MSNEQTPPVPEAQNKEADEILDRSWRRKRFKIPFIFAAIILIKSAVVMVIWNALIPDLFHGPILTYVQALGLSVLAKLLLGFGGGFGRFGGHRGHHWGRHMRGHWRERWSAMSEDDRNKMRDHMRTRHGR